MEAAEAVVTPAAASERVRIASFPSFIFSSSFRTTVRDERSSSVAHGAIFDCDAFHRRIRARKIRGTGAASHPDVTEVSKRIPVRETPESAFPVDLHLLCSYFV